jgi:hypothetical protein
MKKYLSILIFGLLIVSLMPLATINVNGWISGYSYKRVVTVNHNLIPCHLTNFPIMLNLSLNSSHLQIDGDDVVITDMSDNILKYERVNYSSATGVFMCWLNSSYLHSDINTSFNVYYGKIGVSSQATANGVFLSYKGVYHLQNISGNRYDSSRNGNYVIATSTDHTTGLTGGSEFFNARLDKMVTSSKFSSTNSYTFMALMKFQNTTSTTADVIFRVNGNDPASFRYTDNKLHCYFDNVDNAGINANKNKNCWYLVTVVKNSTRAIVYMNGTVEINISNSGSCNNDYVYFGDNALGTDYFTGTFDEIFLSANTKNVSWVTAVYNNLLDYSNFISLGTEGNANVKPINSNNYPIDNGFFISFPLMLSITVNDSNADFMNNTIRSNVSGNWIILKYTNNTLNATITYSFTPIYNNTIYWSSNTTDNKSLWDNDTYAFYVVNVTDCNSSGLWLYLGAMLTLDNGQFFLLILIGLWSYFIYLYYKEKEVIFTFCIICCGLPLGIIISGVAYYNSYPFGYLISFILILISFLIPTYGMYQKNKKKI